VCSRRGAIQIHVYLYLYLTFTWLTDESTRETLVINERIIRTINRLIFITVTAHASNVQCKRD